MENRINHIIARVLSGESSSDDILSLSEWLNENEKNRDEFRRLKNYWDADVAFKHSVAPAFSADKLQQKINVQRRQTARRQLWRNAIPLIAAACLLFIFSTALFLYNTNNRTSEHYTLLTDEHTSNFTTGRRNCHHIKQEQPPQLFRQIRERQPQRQIRR